MGLLFGMLLKCGDDEYPIFEAECHNTPIQPNLYVFSFIQSKWVVLPCFVWICDEECIYLAWCRYDCGIIVLQMMELWDGEKKFDGNTMPNYINVSYRTFKLLLFTLCIIMSFMEWEFWYLLCRTNYNRLGSNTYGNGF